MPAVQSQLVYSSSSGCSSGGARPSRPFRSSSSVIRSTATSVSSASTLAPADPIKGTVSGSGSSTSTNFCSECTNSSRKSSGEIVESAISRSDTTGFLSLSRSIVSCEPDEIMRARWAANRTRSNRLSTLSMQSSTVTRAIDCRSVKWDEYVGLCAVVIGPKGVSQGQICDLPSHSALLTPPWDQKVGASRHWLMPSRTRNRFIALSKVLVFSPLPHHICGGVCRGADPPNFRRQIQENARSVAAAPKTLTTTLTTT